ncbi:hypothetical protein BGI41_02445 [Methanobrevibacter sp. 87.7]|uniref:hypothetical protein n=1 Tax=Methanobrevibacter sp. 87.7 TaxID=387957 RepID=UPI000B5073A2|nr:hypothetical protein [Methanobrevibacter sp. 87.7]OWT33442.1 hypothetical protein BGI41_02445 [Methanobrevibacter sp. 87.7]
MILSLIIIFIIFLTSTISINNQETSILNDKNFEYHIEDYKRNIEIISYNVLNKTINDHIKTREASTNSREEIKNRLNNRLKEINNDYYRNYNIKIDSNVLSVNNDDNPFNINIKVKLNFEKDNNTYSTIETYKISIIGLEDPLPFLKLKNSDLTYNSTNFNYHNSLNSYLNEKSIDGSSYINSSSPLIFKKCPYEPYEIHGNNLSYNCIINNYYHESHDGSCIFCRLEGKADCNHYGLETFIVSCKNDKNKSISSPDHVIFSDNPYEGDKIVINDKTFLFLDNGHKNKYGFN